MIERIFLFACLLFGLFPTSGAFAERRVALVIGNSNYSLAPLTNPKNDADDVTAALRRLRFTVTEATDLTIREFDKTIEQFEARAKHADVALFYFSGHGVQIDKRGYLAPVDIRAESESSALRELVSIQEVVSRIENAAKVSVIVLDACRDSPLQERLRRAALEQNRSLTPQRGLPPVSVVGSNTLIVYATVPGETASDGAGQRNSPFTSALLKHIETPGLEIELMFKRVTAEVLQKTDGKQQPERLSRLQSELVFLTSATVDLPKSNDLDEVRKRLEALEADRKTQGRQQAALPLSPGVQQETNISSLAAAKELLKVVGSAKQFDVVVPLITQQLENAFVNLKPDHAAEIKDVFRAIPEKFLQRKQELLDQVAALYAGKLTVDEINEIIKFYKTPIGAKFIQLQPELVQQSMQLGQAWGRKIGQEIEQDVRKQLKDRGVPI